MNESGPSKLPPLDSGRSAALTLGAPRRRGNVATAQISSKAHSAAEQERYDAAIRSTDGDALSSRIAAMNSGYLKTDPYTLLFGSSSHRDQRSPIINIGTYLRCKAIDNLVDGFLKLNDDTKQIISLGAGSDSRFWQIQSDDNLKTKIHRYIELDFVDSTSSKVEKILRHQELVKLVSSKDEDVQISPDRSSIMSTKYTLLPCDLRTLSSTDSSKERMESIIDSDKDTLILAECVLAYMSPIESAKLLQYLSSLLKRPFAICYEMCVAGDIGGEDAEPDRLGGTMLTNLQGRNLTMPGAKAYSTVQSHASRFEKIIGKGRGKAKTLKKVWHDTSVEDRARLSRVQGLDEVEELEMLLAHYAISWYSHDPSSPFM